MNSSALILMVCTMVVVITTASALFFKVLRTPPRPEPDSYDENDDVPR
ncbi:MAG: hypothetical protein KDC13_02035 [Bacteroidetes bacterium]|nr:hypothetical protein [Bacteroidota bacterium]